MRCAARRRTRAVKILSGGERRRVALCRLLLQKPDILLLDEPTNHLDAESVAWLEHHLQSYPGTIIAVTHDRYFLDNVAGWILELDRGQGIPWKGNYTSWLEQKQERLRQRRKVRKRAAEDAAARTRMDSHVAEGAARQRQSAHQLLTKSLLDQEAREAARRSGDPHSARAAPGQRRDRSGRRQQRLRRQPAGRRHDLHAAARRHRRRDRSQRRRQDDVVSHDHGTGAARQRHDSHRRNGRSWHTSIRAARSIRRNRSGKRSPAARIY